MVPCVLHLADGRFFCRPTKSATTFHDDGRLGALREPFVDVCAAEGISPSEGLRWLIAVAVEGGNGVQAVQAKHRGRARPTGS